MPSVTPSADSGSAPIYNVPQERVVSVEHPCIVKNFDNGFKSLGGEQQLKHVIEHDVQTAHEKGSLHITPVAGVSLRPNDPLAKKLSSTATETQDVLIRVTLPKRTGRKRKRGSNLPFSYPDHAEQQPTSITAPDLLQRLRDNADSYTLEAAGLIQDTHAFRDLPDFQVRAEEVPIMRELRNYALKPDYDTLKKFYIDLKPGSEGITAFPGPPTFASSGQPYRYEYQQWQHTPTESAKDRRPVKAFEESGFSLEADEVPTGPPPDHASPKGAELLEAIKQLNKLLDERPMMTWRVVSSLHDRDERPDKMMREAIMHVGYYVRSGPWQGCIVRYGMDPRSEPKYRFYQTIKYQLKEIKRRVAERDRSERAEAGKEHIFDGKTVAAGKFWQFCDLTEPVLQQIVQSDEIRGEPDRKQWGWYGNGTMTKIRVILRDQMHRIISREPQLPVSDYLLLAAMPHYIDDSTICPIDAVKHGKRLRTLGMAIKSESRFRWGYKYKIKQTAPRPAVSGGFGGANITQVDGAAEDAEDAEDASLHAGDESGDEDEDGASLNTEDESGDEEGSDVGNGDDSEDELAR